MELSLIEGIKVLKQTVKEDHKLKENYRKTHSSALGTERLKYPGTVDYGGLVV